jgi:hypothetical protein
VTRTSTSERSIRLPIDGAGDCAIEATIKCSKFIDRNRRAGFEGQVCDGLTDMLSSTGLFKTVRFVDGALKRCCSAHHGINGSQSGRRSHFDHPQPLVQTTRGTISNAKNMQRIAMADPFRVSA